MKRKTKEVDLAMECHCELQAIRGMLGKQVPLSAWYVAGTSPTLVAIENDLCTLSYSNGAMLYNVPIRDLVDNLSYWKISRRDP